MYNLQELREVGEALTLNIIDESSVVFIGINEQGLDIYVTLLPR